MDGRSQLSDVGMPLEAQPDPAAVTPALPPSRFRLSARALLNLLAIAGVLLLIGLPVSIPIIILDDQQVKRDYWRFGTMPANDSAVLEWLKKQGMRTAVVNRSGGVLHLEYIGNRQSGPVRPPWNELGYSQPYLQRADRSIPPKTATFIAGVFTLIVLFCGARLKRRSARQGIPILLLPQGSMAKSIRLGAAAAGASLLAAYLNAWAATRLFGEDVLKDAPGSWLPHTDSVWLAVVTVAVVAVCAPLAEELLFRGVLFARFHSAGHTLYGIVFTSALFATVHGFWPMIPFYLCMGMLACLAYLKTGALFAPMLAHGLVNGVACAGSFAG